MNHRQIIHDTREVLGISHDEAAAFIGISSTHYWDLENHDDELFTTLALGEIIHLCRLLQLLPRHLLSCEPILPTRQPEEPKHLILSYCRDTSTPIDKFEEQAGWEVQHFLTDPQSHFQKWNLDCLRDVCSAVGANYKEFIPS